MKQHDFVPGSHLVVNFGAYRHHGVYCGDDEVIHFGCGIFDLENAVVEVVSSEVFGGGSHIHSCNSKTTFALDEVVKRARNRLGESGYDLIDNNCEHFVNWCRSGEHESYQVNMSETVARQAAAVAAKPLIQKWAIRFAARTVGGVTAGPAIAAGAADVVQATVEIVSAKRGRSKDGTRRAGQGAGLASSAALGWLVGGPVAAVAGVGFWVMGQVIAGQTVNTGKLALASALGHASKK